MNTERSYGSSFWLYVPSNTRISRVAGHVACETSEKNRGRFLCRRPHETLFSHWHAAPSIVDARIDSFLRLA